MEIEAPLLGHLTDRTVLTDGATVDASSWVRGVVEFEVAVWVGETLGSGTTPDDARAAVRAVGPAIEVADVDLVPGPGTVEAILADDIFHRGVLLGDRDETRAGLHIDGLTAVIEIDGESFAETSDLEAITGRYDEVVATVANTLGAFGEHLVEGAVIITGSVIPPVPIDAGERFSFRLGDYAPLTLRRA